MITTITAKAIPCNSKLNPSSFIIRYDSFVGLKKKNSCKLSVASRAEGAKQVNACPSPPPAPLFQTARPCLPAGCLGFQWSTSLLFSKTSWDQPTTLVRNSPLLFLCLPGSEVGIGIFESTPSTEHWSAKHKIFLTNRANSSWDSVEALILTKSTCLIHTVITPK